MSIQDGINWGNGIIAQGLPYVYGGGHSNPYPDFYAAHGGYDCSGFASNFICASGWDFPSSATPTFASAAQSIGWTYYDYSYSIDVREWPIGTCFINPNAGMNGHVVVVWDHDGPYGHIAENGNTITTNYNFYQSQAVVPEGEPGPGPVPPGPGPTPFQADLQVDGAHGQLIADNVSVWGSGLSITSGMWNDMADKTRGYFRSSRPTATYPLEYIDL